MGQIPNKTYTAPDGSVYCVEADGSVTKIKGGRVQSNEPPSKYNITPDGKIYRVESDGSVTYLGNAEDRQYPPHYATSNNTKRSGRKLGWVIAILILMIVVAIGIYIANDNSSTNYERNYSNFEQTESPIETSDDGSVQSSEEYGQSYNHSSSNETPANESEQWAFIEDGNYYGTIGNVRIYGVLNLPTENPEGTLYYSGNNSEFYIAGTSDGKYWSEYYGDEITGEIQFDFWDLAYKNFARGTYTRNSDGKQFSIELYKTNF